MDSDNQVTKELKKKFRILDENHDGFISPTQLQKFMKQDKLFSIPIWKTNEILQMLQNKMDEDDFVIWIMGCRSGLEDLAKIKFQFSNHVKSLRTASPPTAINDIKRSFINISINQQSNKEKKILEHFIQLIIGVNKQEQAKKRKQLFQVLGRESADINFVLRLRTIKNGYLIAEKIQQLTSFGLALLSELGPAATPIIQSLQITSKWMNDNIYLIIELKNQFFSILLKYLNQAIEELSPQRKCFLKAKVESDFTNILNNDFNPLLQSINAFASLQIGKNCLEKLKQKIIEDFQKQKDEEKLTLLIMFLFQQLKLSLQSSNLKDCLQSFGYNQVDIPNPGSMGKQIQNIGIKQLISQFVPQGDKLLDLISQDCKPQGSISLCAGNLGVQFSFNLNIKGALNLL